MVNLKEWEEIHRLKEPLVHSGITDCLPDEHPLAYETISCKLCKITIHASNNEVMNTWVETGAGNFCIKCFASISETEGIDDKYALTGEKK